MDMRQTIRMTVVACTIAVILCGSGCVSRRKYRASQDALKKCQDGTEAFQVIIDNDAFAQFMPMTNQFWDKFLTGAKPAKYYSGFLVQLAIMKRASHVPSDVVLTMADGTTTSLKRDEAKWLNVVCEPTPGTPLPAELARLLVPDATDPATNDRLLHKSIMPASVSLLTMWRAGNPMSVQTGEPDTASDHGHDRFVFSSPVGCTVEVWSDMNASAPKTTYATGRVTKMRVSASNAPSPHGGAHQPWWDFGQ